MNMKPISHDSKYTDWLGLNSCQQHPKLFFSPIPPQWASLHHCVETGSSIQSAFYPVCTRDICQGKDLTRKSSMAQLCSEGMFMCSCVNVVDLMKIKHLSVSKFVIKYDRTPKEIHGCMSSIYRSLLTYHYMILWNRQFK